MTELVLKWEKTVQNDEREYEKVKNEENRHMNVSEASFFRLFLFPIFMFWDQNQFIVSDLKFFFFFFSV